MFVRITVVLLPSSPVALQTVIVVSTKFVSMATVSILAMLDPMLVEPMLNVPFLTTVKAVLVPLDLLVTLKSNVFVSQKPVYRAHSALLV